MRSPLVLGEGPKDAKIVIIGEAPGDDEVVEGRPFVGAAGKLLNTLLSEAGINRDECYITNVVKEKPPGGGSGGKVEHFFPKPHQPTAHGEIYLELLDRELRGLVNPYVFVPLGAIALAATTQYRGIKQLRGKVIEGKYGKTIPTIHPAACFKGQWKSTFLIKFDLLKAKEQSQYANVRYKQRELLCDPPEAVVFDALERISRGPYLSLDFEADQISSNPVRYSDTPTRIGLSNDPAFGISIGFQDKQRNYYYPPKVICAIWRKIEQIIMSGVPFIAQNCMYDIYILCKKFGIFPPNLWIDTMIANKIIFPELDKGLEFLVSFWLSEAPYKKKIDTNAMMNAKDAAYTGEIGLMQWAYLLKNKNKMNTFKRSLNLVEPLMCMSLQGTKCDLEAREIVRQALGVEIKELKYKLRNIVGYDLNVNSNKQMREHFYKKLGLRPYTNRKTGGETLNEDALLRITKKGYSELVFTIIGLRKKLKLMSTYVEMGLSDEGRFHCTYNIAGTKTGRLSSSELINMGGNLQTIPVPEKRGLKHNIRNFFVAEPGMVLVEKDLEQAESRVVAFLAEDPFMKKIFKEGGDIHREMASIIFDKYPADITYMERYDTKHLAHAYNYGEGPERARNEFLKDGHDISLRRINWIFQAISRNFPNIDRWKEGIRLQLHKTRKFVTPLGRESWFLEKWGDDLFREAYAFVPQSTIGDLLNIVLRSVYDYPDLITWIDLLMQVHDSFIYQCPEDRVKESLSIIDPLFNIPIKINNDTLIVPAGTKVGKSWGEMEEL